MNISEADLDETTLKDIKDKQTLVINTLLEKLNPDNIEDDHLNGCTVLIDMIENNKNFYQQFMKKEII